MLNLVISWFLLSCCPFLRKVSRLIRSSFSLCFLFSFFNKMINFHGTLYEHFAVFDHHNIYFLQSLVITTLAVWICYRSVGSSFADSGRGVFFIWLWWWTLLRVAITQITCYWLIHALGLQLWEREEEHSQHIRCNLVGSYFSSHPTRDTFFPSWLY
jgi:hypothetical protein